MEQISYSTIKKIKKFIFFKFNDKIFNSDTKSNELCKPLWDTKLCWPMAVLGETVELTCPDQEYSYQTATRTCIFYNDEVVWTMANYSLCSNPENYAGLIFAIARDKFINVHEEVSLNFCISFLSNIFYYYLFCRHGSIKYLRSVRSPTSCH